MGAPNFPRKPHSRPRVTVGVVSPMHLFRECLVLALSRVAGFMAIDLGDGDLGTFRRFGGSPRDVLLLDLACHNAHRLVREGQVKSKTAAVVAVGSRSDDEVISLAEAGFTGFLPLEASLEDLCRAITRAREGELECSPRLTAALARRLGTVSRRNAVESVWTQLTARESQIAELIGQGLSNKDIATRLSVETATIKNHVHNLLEKVGVHRRGEAAARLAGSPRLESTT